MSRVGLLIPWCRLSDLSKCNIPVHMFYLFYESHYTMSRCLIQGVIFFRTTATVVDLWILQSGSALAPVMQAGFGLRECSVLFFANFHFIH